MNMIYGVDTSKEITPLMIRDAIVECFYNAHREDVSLGDSELANRSYCDEIVKKMFDESSADFNNPTKESIIKVLTKLKEFSIHFRDPEIINKHEAEIMELVRRLK